MYEYLDPKGLKYCKKCAEGCDKCNGPLKENCLPFRNYQQS